MAGVLTAECGTAPCLLVCGCWKPSPGSDPSDHSELAVPSLHPSLLSLSVLLGSSPHTALATPAWTIPNSITYVHFQYQHCTFIGANKSNFSVLNNTILYSSISSTCTNFHPVLSPCSRTVKVTARPSPDLHSRVVSSGLLVVAPCVGTWSRLSQTLS